MTEGIKCSVCGEILKAQEEIPALGHTEEIIPGKAATCTEKGLTEGVKCSVCGEILKAQEEIPALGHTEEIIPGKAATCTEKGLTEGVKCSVCGEILKAQEEIPALGHIPAAAVREREVPAAIGIAGGYDEVVYCSVCHAELSRASHVIPALEPTATPAPTATPTPELTATPAPTATPTPEPTKRPDASGEIFAVEKAVGDNALRITWNEAENVDGYDVFFAKCGTRAFERKASVAVGKKRSVTVKGLKAHTSYKSYIRAWVMENGKQRYVLESTVAHCYTGGGTAKQTNPKRVKVSQSKLSINLGAKASIKATVTGLEKGKKLPTHVKALRYLSGNPAVATVSGSGRVKAVGVGVCKIYVYAANGLSKVVEVTVAPKVK